MRTFPNFQCEEGHVRSSADVVSSGSGVHRRHHCRWCGRELERRPPLWARESEDLEELGVFTIAQYRRHLEQVRHREFAERAWERLSEAEEAARAADQDREREDQDLYNLERGDGRIAVQLDLLDLCDPPWDARTAMDELFDGFLEF